MVFECLKELWWCLWVGIVTIKHYSILTERSCLQSWGGDTPSLQLSAAKWIPVSPILYMEVLSLWGRASKFTMFPLVDWVKEFSRMFPNSDRVKEFAGLLISACPLLLGTFTSAESKWCSTLYVLIYNLDPNLCPKFSASFPHNRHWKKKVLHKSGSFYITRFRDFFLGCRSSTIVQQFFRGTWKEAVLSQGRQLHHQ